MIGQSQAKLILVEDKAARIKEFHNRINIFAANYDRSGFFNGNRTKTITDFVYEVLESPEITELLRYNYPFEVYHADIPNPPFGFENYTVYAQICQGELKFFSLYSKHFEPIQIEPVSRRELEKKVWSDCMGVLATMHRRLDTILREEFD